MTTILIILSILSIILSLFSIFCIWRLFKYIKYIIEEKQDDESERLDNVISTLKLIVKGDLIKDNGKIKKPYI